MGSLYLLTLTTGSNQSNPPILPQNVFLRSRSSEMEDYGGRVSDVDAAPHSRTLDTKRGQ